MPPSETRLLAATILAPLLAAMLLGVAAASTMFSPTAPIAGVITYSAIVGPIALFGLIGMLLLGLPGHALLLRVGRREFLAYALVGLAAGALLGALILYAAYAYSPHSETPSFETALVLVLPCILGGVTAAIFWLIRRPDRDAPRSSSRTREA